MITPEPAQLPTLDPVPAPAPESDPVVPLRRLPEAAGEVAPDRAQPADPASAPFEAKYR